MLRSSLRFLPRSASRSPRAFPPRRIRHNPSPCSPMFPSWITAERRLASDSPPRGSSQDQETSSIRNISETSKDIGNNAKNESKDLLRDLQILRDTLRMNTIPRESRILGLCGTIPYFATSLSTIFLAWNLAKELPTHNAFYDTILVDHDTARSLLDLIEPLQLGYGAVIISFLGAIHWGLEYAEKEPQHDRTRFRYGMGLASSIIAWPTLLMPVQFSLITQFMAFVAFYYADSRATTRGWAPPWYAKYRFLLTAMVGLAIFVSLVGRTKIEQRGALNKQNLRSKMTRPGIADKETNWAELEEEERQRNKREKEAAEEKAAEAKAAEAKDQKEDIREPEEDKTEIQDEEKDSGSDEKEKDDPKDNSTDQNEKKQDDKE